MTMVSSGTIALAGTATSGGKNESIQVELGGSGSSQISLNDSDVRSLASISSGQISLSDFYGKSSFTPVTHTYTSGSANETVPTGASSLVITMYSGGGSGGAWSSSGSGPPSGPGGGGGGGALCIKTIAIASSDWGGTLAYSVGAGLNSSVSGTLNAGSLSLLASAGQAGLSGHSGGGGGAAGTSTGGDTNTSGSAGISGSSTSAGGNAASGGGTGGAAGAQGTAPGGGGGGGTFSGQAPGAATAGQISFAWT